ncbi:MAG TPA: isoprenyl transferase [Crocinitomicaceae bacterium]|nr:isoprenyl transferase [Crocinitomicaceae bacterium]
MRTVFDKIDKKNVPQHVAVIMDGNGRWAKNRGEERIFGHLNGVESVRSTLKAALKSGVRFLTLYAFSTENWNRPQDEINALMELLVTTISNEVEELSKQGVRLRTIGDLDALPSSAKIKMLEAQEQTKSNSKIDLILALSYSSRWEITRAIKNIVDAKIPANKITEELVNEYLCTKDIPDPELLVRTSGEIRVSNFLMWQIAYSELYFTPTLWPEFSEEEFFKALIEYQSRERRFGKISEQIT